VIHWLQEKDPNWVVLFVDFIMAQFRVKANGKVLLIDAEDIGIIDRRHVRKCKSLQIILQRHIGRNITLVQS